jgi:hypothetical protein
LFDESRVIHTERLIARIALLLSLALAWLNLLLTARWAAVPGSVNGPKYPFYLAALTLASVLAWQARPGSVRMRAFPAIVCGGSLAFLAFAFLTWFPVATWSLVPFLDDWPPRFQSTLEGYRLLQALAFSGWRWTFLGGYPIATDVSQDLTAWAAIPMWLLGPTVGFHATHLLLFAAIPALVWLDLRIAGADRDVTVLAAGLAALFSTGFSYFLIRSGDTNSLAGVVATAATLVAAHAARQGARGAPLALVVALTVTSYSHRGFFVYALCFLTLDALLARDWRAGGRVAVATAAALLGSLPITWDMWRHPAYFIVNNVDLTPAPFVLIEFLRKVYYNAELLVRPGRWFNDYTGLVNVFLPVVAFVAWRGRDRIRFYALATLGVVALVRLNYWSFGYAFLRPIHLLPVFVAPVLAWFIVRCTGTLRLAVALVAVLALYVQVWLVPVPHVRTVRDFDAALVDRLSGLDGHLVLIENAFHRDVDVRPDRSSLPTPFDVHYEALLPDATGRRFYAGMWDGWQWTPYRDQVFANGTFRGRAVSDVPVSELVAEIRRWGVRHLLVWSEPAKRYLQSSGELVSRWETARWREFELMNADVRSVVTAHGQGALEGTHPLGARVHLTNARRGDPVIVRTNYHPAWRARAGTAYLDLSEVHGQLAFMSPADGDVVVELEYPARRWLIPIALGGLAAAWWVMLMLRPRITEPQQPTPKEPTLNSQNANA